MLYRSLPFLIFSCLCSENLKVIPDLLETLISEKRFLQASVLLVRSFKTINSADLLEVGAVSDLRSYLAGQETVRRDLINKIFIHSRTLSHYEKY
jgi:hypothetical protein